MGARLLTKSCCALLRTNTYAPRPSKRLATAACQWAQQRVLLPAAHQECHAERWLLLLGQGRREQPLLPDLSPVSRRVAAPTTLFCSSTITHISGDGWVPALGVAAAHLLANLPPTTGKGG